jgi:hypothetical protein
MRVAAEFSVMFRPLAERGESLVFPCDREGHVDLDTASEHMRNIYLFARGMIGHQFLIPVVLVKDRQ